ncbi:MAG: hypothetical protein IPJ34_42340 [Myxococcales bacterium]|nr:hypothetical protein [Myxococcales bacterium]
MPLAERGRPERQPVVGRGEPAREEQPPGRRGLLAMREDDERDGQGARERRRRRGQGADPRRGDTLAQDPARHEVAIAQAEALRRDPFAPGVGELELDFPEGEQPAQQAAMTLVALLGEGTLRETQERRGQPLGGRSIGDLAQQVSQGDREIEETLERAEGLAEHPLVGLERAEGAGGGPRGVGARVRRHVRIGGVAGEPRERLARVGLEAVSGVHGRPSSR